MKNLAPGTCPASGTLEPECPYCARYTNQHEAFKSGNGPPPASCPSLATSVASGDEFVPEVIRWARPTRDVLHHRLETSGHIARVLNSILEAREMPNKMSTYRTTPIPKATRGTDGDAAQRDMSSPDLYRPITVGGLLGKILAIAICSRLYHWTARHKIINPEQAASANDKRRVARVVSD
jgi:hypothetical protein